MQRLCQVQIDKEFFVILIYLLALLFQVYTLLLFARILGSWFPQLQHYTLFRFIAFYTDPYLDIFRKIIPPFGMIDLSPIVAFLCLGLIEKILTTLLMALFT